jgi:hypothetical protein
MILRPLGLLSVIVSLVSMTACNIPPASPPQPATATMFVTIPATETPTPAPLNGTITGHLSYPSEFIPTLKVVAFDVTDPSVYYFVETEMNQGEYVLQVPPGTYYIISYVDKKDGTLGMPGAYSQFVPCGLQASCSDHSLIPVTVAAGQTVTGIDPADWYAPEGTFPTP